MKPKEKNEYRSERRKECSKYRESRPGGFKTVVAGDCAANVSLSQRRVSGRRYAVFLSKSLVACDFRRAF